MNEMMKKVNSFVNSMKDEEHVSIEAYLEDIKEE